MWYRRQTLWSSHQAKFVSVALIILQMAMKLTWIVAVRFVQGVPIQKAADIMMTVQVVNVKSLLVAVGVHHVTTE